MRNKKIMIVSALMGSVKWYCSQGQQRLTHQDSVFRLVSFDLQFNSPPQRQLYPSSHGIPHAVWYRYRTEKQNQTRNTQRIEAIQLYCETLLCSLQASQYKKYDFLNINQYILANKGMISFFIEVSWWLCDSLIF